MNNTEYIPIAALNQYAYCPHRCWRMFCAEEFIDNQYTIEGTSLHERVHTLGEGNREETWQVRAIYLKSDKYQLIGKSDLIELENGEWYPVEYKRGRKGEWDNDELQVCAQALCYSLLKSQRSYSNLDLNGRLNQLATAIANLDQATSINSIRGLEGAGSAAYFGCFNQLIRVDNFQFHTRNRRPPTDPVNSLLSLGYALLRHDVQSAINIVGFDPYLGYLHTERYGRPSLALDLMEEFRPVIVDAIVLAAINRRILSPTDFITEPVSNAVSLTKEGLHKFLRLYQEKKQTKFKHPVMQKQYTYQESFELQARLLAKYLMGEIEKYPPLVMK